MYIYVYIYIYTHIHIRIHIHIHIHIYNNMREITGREVSKKSVFPTSFDSLTVLKEIL